MICDPGLRLRVGAPPGCCKFGLDKSIFSQDTHAMVKGPLDATGFDWDDGILSKMWEKHGVSAAECEEVFFNSPIVSGPDEKHSGQEIRYCVLGQTDSRRRVFIVFTLRRELIRVVTARDISRREREVFVSHEEKEEDS